MTYIDVIKHILPYNSGMECLINYCIFKSLKICCSLRRYAQIIPHVSQSAQTLYYITLHFIILHYISMVLCNLHCIYFILHYITMVFCNLHCIYEHEAIQNPISENNIGAPLAPQ